MQLSKCFCVLNLSNWNPSLFPISSSLICSVNYRKASPVAYNANHPENPELYTPRLIWLPKGRFCKQLPLFRVIANNIST